MEQSHVHTAPLPCGERGPFEEALNVPLCLVRGELSSSTCGQVGGGSNTSIPFLQSILRPRPAEGHKGTFGHALLVAGSYGMAGAGILAGRSCMRSGVGKLTVHIPWRNNDIMQVALPEAILNHDEDDKRWTCSPFESCLPNKYSAIGIGPGIGREEKTAEALYKTLLELKFTEVPLVLDADALNILAEHPQWADLIPNNTIITPHPLEYRRLVESGVCLDNVILVLKGHPTTITIPGNPSVKYECPYGNNGMGTAGSGDVLTGIILGLLAQGYPPRDAALLGVGLHALSGDLAAGELGQHSLIASDLIKYLHKAFNIITT